MIEQFQPQPLCLRLRQAMAWPIYTIALVFDLVSAGPGRLAAWIAGDDWPR